MAEYIAITPGGSNLRIKLVLNHEPPDINSNSTVVKYTASIYQIAGGWYNLLSQTPMKLVIGGQTILNVSNGNFDVRNGEQVIKTGQITVQHNQDGTMTIPFEYVCDFRNTYYTVYGVTSVSGDYTLPNIPRTSTSTISGDLEFDKAFTVSINRTGSNFTHNVSYTINGETTSVSSNATTSASITVPSSKAISNTQSKYALSVKVVTKNGNTVIGEQIIEKVISLNPTTNKPVIKSVIVMETVTNVSQAFQTNTRLLSGISKLRVGLSQVEYKSGATLDFFYARVKQHPDVSLNSKVALEMNPFNFPTQGTQDIQIEFKAVDSRGFESDWFSSYTLTVHAYKSPQLGTMTPRRGGDATSVIVVRNWAVQSITTSGSTTEINTATLKFYTREKGSTSWVENAGAGSTALSGMNSSANLSGFFAGNKIYEIKAVLSDKFRTIETAPIPVGTESLPMSWSPEKVAIGAIVDKNGATLQVAGDSDVSGEYKLKGKSIQNLKLSENDGRALRFIGDLNNLINSGFYMTHTGESTNLPPIAGHPWKYIIVTRHDDYHVSQLAIDFSNTYMAIRTSTGYVASGRVWKTWTKLSTETDILNAITNGQPDKFANYRNNTFMNWVRNNRVNTLTGDAANANNLTNGMWWVWGTKYNCPPTDGLFMSYQINDVVITQIVFGANNLIYQRIKNGNTGVWAAWSQGR